MFFIGIHTNWSYVVCNSATFVPSVQPIVAISSDVLSSIKYITKPPPIVFSVSTPDTVNPAGITATFPLVSIYKEVSIAFEPADIILLRKTYSVILCFPFIFTVITSLCSLFTFFVSKLQLSICSATFILSFK